VYKNGLPADGIESMQSTAEVNGRVYASTYSQFNRTFTTSTPEGRVATVTLNEKARVAQTQVPNVLPVSYEYNALGQLTKVTQGVRTSAYSYDAQGNLASATDALNRQATYQYNKADRVEGMTLPGGRTLTASTDAHGSVTSLSPPGQSSHDMAYTSVDLLQSYSPPASTAGAPKNSTSYAYNKDKQLLQVSQPGGGNIQLQYDNVKGRLNALTMPGRSVQYSYNAKGQLEKAAFEAGASFQHAYDGELLKEVKWSGSQLGTVSYAYDADFRVNSLSVNGVSIAYGYDKDSLLTSVGGMALGRRKDNGFLDSTTLGNVTSAYRYTPYGELEGHTYSASANALYSEARTYDVLGRTVSRVEVTQGVSTSQTYTYDAAGRLESVSENGVEAFRYGYDANGNRTSVKSGNSTTTATYDGEDRLQKLGSVNYTFSPLGQLAERKEGANVTRYQFDAVGTLQKVTLPNNQTVEYELDAAGRRVGKRLNGAKRKGWLYDGALRVIAQTDAGGNVTQRYVYATQGHSPDYVIAGGSTYRVVKDMLGSVRLVVDTVSGEVKQRIDYDVWGKVTSNSAPSFQPFGYAGGLLDSDTGLTRFGAREYEADSGRWVSKDPIGFAGGDSNLFAYVGNRPVDYVDPEGKAWKLVVRVAGAGIRAVKNISRRQALRVAMQGGDVATDSAKGARKLAKDVSRARGGGGRACHPEAHGNGATHLHGLDEAGKHLSGGHIFIEELKGFAAFVLDPNDDGQILDPDDLYELLNPLPFDTRPPVFNPNEMI
jgi:RHS repeat-associated protein